MGLMDSLKDRALNEAEGRYSGLSSQYPIASQVLGMFGSGGIQGLRGLVVAFHKGGLGGVISTWIGTGENQPITADQVERALGDERIQQIASKFGMDPATVKAQLAQALPALVDKMTPHGTIPEGH
jgi:uncharacterized protein YidB (DUF937 family)